MRGDDDSIGYYMPVFLGDYWADTGDLDCEEHGAYTQLLFRLWSASGRLAFDPPRLARLIHLDPAKWDRVWNTVRRFFKVEDGWVTQGRVSRELQKARDLRQKRVEGGRLGAAVKQRKRKRSRSPQGELKPPSPSPSGSPSGPPPQTPTPEGEGGIGAARPPGPVIASPLPRPCETSNGPSKAPTRTRPLITAGSGSGYSAPSSYDQALGAFKSAWKRRYHADYLESNDERSELVRLLTRLPPDRIAALPACFERYLADENTFIAQEKRHSLYWFFREHGENKYLVDAPVLSPKEARGKTAAAQWLGARNAKN